MTATESTVICGVAVTIAIANNIANVAAIRAAFRAGYWAGIERSCKVYGIPEDGPEILERVGPPPNPPI
jgi:hypothetical protein